jgi:hypothetical protein
MHPKMQQQYQPSFYKKNKKIKARSRKYVRSASSLHSENYGIGSYFVYLKSNFHRFLSLLRVKNPDCSRSCVKYVFCGYRPDNFVMCYIWQQHGLDSSLITPVFAEINISSYQPWCLKKRRQRTLCVSLKLTSSSSIAALVSLVIV